jgi:hypothetical protein
MIHIEEIFPSLKNLSRCLLERGQRETHGAEGRSYSLEGRCLYWSTRSWASFLSRGSLQDPLMFCGHYHETTCLRPTVGFWSLLFYYFLVCNVFLAEKKVVRFRISCGGFYMTQKGRWEKWRNSEVRRKESRLKGVEGGRIRFSAEELYVSKERPNRRH